MAIQGELVGKYITGEDILIKSCNVIVHQPKIKDILLTGEDGFLLAAQLLIKTEEFFEEVRKGNSELSALSDFQLLLVMYSNDVTIRTHLNIFFELVFPLYKVVLTENSIDFIEKENTSVVTGKITPFNFEDLQKTLEHLFIPYTEKKEAYNPANSAAEEIAKKIKEGQNKRMERQGVQKVPQSLLGSFCSILSIGIPLDMNILLSYTPFQLFDSYMRFEKKQAEDQYIKLVTVPFADSSHLEQPESWSENLYN